MRIGKHNFTKIATIQASVSAVLFLLGLVLALWAYGDYSVYGGFRAGLRAQAAGRYQDALKPLAAVARAREEYPFPAELDAKLKVDAGTPGSLEGAIGHYRWLAEKNHGDRPTVKLGLAAAYLCLSDLKSKGDRPKLWARAAKALSGVKWPEARIIRAHIALRKGEFAAAKKDLESAYKDARQGKVLIGKDSLTDLYVGLGICSAHDKHYLEASRMFRRANHLEPSARNPMLNSIYLLARRYAETPPPRDEMVTTYNNLIRRARNVWKREYDRDPQTYRGMDRAILTFVLSVTWGLVRQNEIEPHAFTALSSSSGLSSNLFDKGRFQLTQAAACIALLKRPGLNSGQRNDFRTRATRALAAAVRHFGDKPELIGRIQYLKGMLETQAARDGGFRDSGRIARAREAFTRAVARLPGDASLRRNYGAFLLMTGKKKEALAELEKSLELDDKSPGQEKVRETVATLKAGG
jgi:tetratricopeptide (TPR) repeat protein